MAGGTEKYFDQRQSDSQRLGGAFYVSFPWSGLNDWPIISNCVFLFRTLPRIGDELFSVWGQCFLVKDRGLMFVGIVSLFWCVWKLRNAACFECKAVVYPNEVMFLCQLNITMLSCIAEKWGKQTDGDPISSAMEQIAREVFDNSKGWRPAAPRFQWMPP